MPAGPLGRLDLWTEKHMPKGTVHIEDNRAASVAKKLKIHFQVVT